MTLQEKNIKIVKDMFSAYNKGDIKTITEHLAGDKCDWKIPMTNDFTGLDFAKPRSTRQEVESFFKEFLAVIDPIEAKTLRYTAQDDRVIVELNDLGRIKATGKEYSTPAIMVIELKNEKVTMLHYYMDTSEVRRALEGKISKAA
jgi:ketosteroid isomerase-like protein